MLYAYECPKCGDKWEEVKAVKDRHGVNCGKCGVKAIKLISNTEALIFHPAWFHDISEESVYITSKRQLREECKKHNVLAARLL